MDRDRAHAIVVLECEKYVFQAWEGREGTNVESDEEGKRRKVHEHFCYGGPMAAKET
jgi:hypothetical protein